MSDETHTSSASEDPGIGPALRKARIQSGLSLEEVEQATKIRKRYLDGLEREDYDMLPAAVYVQGFLKTYANYLGLDGDAISQEFKRGQTPQGADAYSAPGKSEFDEPLINPGGVAGARRRGISAGTIVTAVVALLVLFLVVGGLYFVGRGSQQASENGPPRVEPAAQRGQTGDNGQASADDDPPDGAAETTQEPALEPETTAETMPETSLETTSESTTEPAPSDTLRVEIQVEGRPSWLEVRTDSEVAYVRVAEPGFSETFEARRRLKVTTGDAGAVSVSVNGQDVGVLGESGEVLTRKWTLKQES
ncbi:MAG: helix-turn-helix domain-containing protein [Rubrobacteraceae bacterium]